VSADPSDLSPNRRRFVTWAAGSTAAVILSNRKVHAQSTTGSSGARSLVCIHLIGGADGWDAAVPQSVAGSSAWNRLRPTLSSASRIVTSGRGDQAISFHPVLAPLAELYDSGRLALFAGVGSLSPTLPGRPPTGAMTHADLRAAALPGGFLLPDWIGDTAGALYDFPSARSAGQSSPIAVALQRAIPRSMDASERRSTAAGLLRSAASADSHGVSFPDTSLGRQLQQIFALIASGKTSGAVHSAILGGFDTHAGQASASVRIWSEFAGAVSAFQTAVETAGLGARVALYTDSEFGRAVVENLRGGTGHGWSSLQFVLGGSVAGGRVYGSFPSLAPGGSGDISGQGVFVPAMSRDAYFATLAAWHGMGFGDVMRTFPGVTSAAALSSALI